MPHLHDAALVWAALVNRKDHAFLVREALGRLWSRSLQGSQVVDEAYIKDMILLKTIIDIQRSRIRSDPPSRFILSINDILDCLDCLCQAGAALLQSSQVNSTVRGVLELSQRVFFSGVLAATLTIEREDNRMTTTRQQVSRLEMCICKWPLKVLYGLAGGWCMAILKGAVEALRGSTNTDSSCDGHFVLDATDCDNFAFTFDLSTCVPQAIACVVRGCGYGYRSALLLADIRLMLIAACFGCAKNDSNPELSTGSSESTIRNLGSTPVTDELNTVLEQCKTLDAYCEALQSTDEGRSLSNFLTYIEPWPSSSENAEIVNWMGHANGAQAVSRNTSTLSAHYLQIVEDLEHRLLTALNADAPLLRVYNHLSEQVRSWTSLQVDNPLSQELEIPDRMFSQKNSTVRKARRIAPLCEIYETLQRLATPGVELEESADNRENTPLASDQLSAACSVRNQEALLPDQASAMSYSRAPAPPTPSIPSLYPSSVSLGSFTDRTSSLTPSAMAKMGIHKRSKSHMLQHSPHLRSALSPDASNLIVWARNRIARRALDGDNPRWQTEKVMHDITLAATGASHFATVNQENYQPLQLSLFDATGALVGKMPFTKIPQSLAFSCDGTKLAIAAIDELRIISTNIADWSRSYCSQSLIPRSNQVNGSQIAGSTFSASGKVRTQMVSFSTDQRQVLVGTQYQDEAGSTLFSLFDLPDRPNGKIPHPFRFVKDIKVTKLTAGQESLDPGLTALPCSHRSGQTILIIGTASAHSHQPAVERIMPRHRGQPRPQADPQPIIGPRLSIARVHCAIATPGQNPCFVVVNEETSVYIIRKSSSRNEWEAEHVSILSGLRPFEKDSKCLGIQIAASSASNVTMFHIRHRKGYLTQYDASDSAQQHQQIIALDNFYPAVADPGQSSKPPNN
ncbi:Serine/threonine-protein kinase VPS15 [Fonsecaea nubica]|uniref:Serine/threonine-protein kinase VPS15 n=1 Tax=Fonsecaea nubica TaxID=856822 RepID=A0A178D6X7_9EURO|nr:Serine/threonine-protein kinase VPS15 [Fonsecaea nubica]OAL37980.1 Serine/threonine-protein kinase VPS15 [Fonsecaea nubica]